MALAACSALTSEGAAVDQAYLVLAGRTATITVADTVTHGAPFAIQIATLGGGCVRETAGEDVGVSGQSIEIRPYNRVHGGQACSNDLLYLVHTVTVQVPAAGTATITVDGLTDSPAAGAADNTTTIQRTIVVR